MHDIEFRGKRTDNGEWVYGNLVRGCDEQYAYIVEFGNEELCRNYVDVDPETVGQYTNLKDKNGTKIFEGDIIHAISNFDAADMVVIYESSEFRLVLCEDYKTYTPGWGFKCLCYERFNMQVIGNIYDNPELLGGET